MDANVCVERAQWSAPKHIHAVTTQRVGGVSGGPWAALNLGLHVGDDEASVLANRQHLTQFLNLPQEPCWLNQVHGTEIVMLEEYANPNSTITADGAIASNPGLVCAVMTADCMPVFICDANGEQVAVVHAGWRGLAAGIVELAIARMRAEPKQLMVWAGPCIGPEHFEVGVEVQAQLGGLADNYRPHRQAGKVYADLYKILGERLVKLGVGEYSHSSACTFRDQQKYFSYRRDGECGRMASLIWIDV